MFPKRELQSPKFKIQSLFFLVSFCFFSIASQAQCAMCRAALESEGNGVKVEAVNDGIVYLMAVPYVLVAVAGYYIYQMKIKTSKK